MKDAFCGLNRKLFSFFMIGCVNCAVGLSVMLFAYNFLHLGYWLSTALNYSISSLVSYYLNGKYTFKGADRSWNTFLRFAGNIICCYILAYSLALPLIRILFLNAPQILADNISMICGMVLFSCFNFIGQSRFVFVPKSLAAAS